MALSENLEPAAGQFREALRFSSDFMPATVYLGACLAANGRDREAMAAWQLAGATETATPLASELLSDALMRAKNHSAALDILTDARTRWPDEPALARRIAVAQIAAGQRDEGLATLEALLAKRGDDLDALFLAIYVLASDERRPLEAAASDRLARHARAYVDAQGPYRAIVEQWLEEVAIRK
jgi:thioredoxin-like negative regulator of GroEL